MKNITVIGAGQMGNGIAHVFALKGFSVQLVDVSAPALEKALATIAKNNERMVGKGTITAEEMTACMQNIQTNTSLADACKTADLVVEAATENKAITTTIVGWKVPKTNTIRIFSRSSHHVATIIAPGSTVKVN